MGVGVVWCVVCCEGERKEEMKGEGVWFSLSVSLSHSLFALPVRLFL